MNENPIVVAGKTHRDYEWLIYFWIDEPDVSYILAVEKLFNIQAVINFAISVALHMELLIFAHWAILECNYNRLNLADIRPLWYFYFINRVNRHSIADSGGVLVDSNEIATIVRQRRRSLNLTQIEVADLAEVSERLIRDLEGGRLTVRTDKLKAILTALGLEIKIIRTHGTS